MRNLFCRLICWNKIMVVALPDPAVEAERTIRNALAAVYGSQHNLLVRYLDRGEVSFHA